jgi:membrane protease YdiL (CAAX protease family)
VGLIRALTGRPRFGPLGVADDVGKQDRGQRPEASLSSWIRQHPVSAFYVLAYACSWAIAVPLALQAQGILTIRLPFALHYLSGLGPAIAALAVTRLLRRVQPGSLHAGQQRGVSLFSWWPLVGFLSPLLFFALAQLAARAGGRPAPTWTDLGRVNFLPDLGLWAWALWLIANGWGEELGWRGFALPRLQRQHSALTSSFLLSIAWAGWHLPAFFYVPSYVALGLWILPGFFLGILAGTIVLTWLYNSSRGSVLAVVLWHASFNFVSASPNAGGFVAAATSTLVMVWAIVIVWQYRGATLAAGPKHVTPAGVLAADDAQFA